VQIKSYSPLRDGSPVRTFEQMNLHALSSNRQLTHFLQTSRLFCELAGFFIGYEVLLEVKGEALIDLFF